MSTVRIPPILRPDVGGKREVTIEADTVGEALQKLVAEYPALDGRVLDTIHAPYVVTPTERGRLRKFLERLGTAWYGFGWRSYDYAGHRIIGHRGGINGYRSLILFDPEKKSGAVALWNSNTSDPGAVEFEVMDMVYHLPFRDWLELNMPAGAASAPEQSDEDAPNVASAGIPQGHAHG